MSFKESLVDDPDLLILKQVEENPVYYDEDKHEFINLPPTWKEELKKLNLSSSEEVANANNILQVLKFYQGNKPFAEKFLFTDNELDVAFDDTDFKVVERKITSKYMSTNDFVDKIKNLVGSVDPVTTYKLYHPVGKGATATVYHALNQLSHTDVAIKEMKVADLSRRDLVYEEIEMMRNIKHHNIVNYLDCFLLHNNAMLWLVMEYLDGGSLSNVAFYTMLQEFQVAHIMRECMQGLAYLHSRRIIHRDVKSDNVLLGLTGSVKLTDFGFCAKLASESEARASCVGTLYWMAPEVVKQKAYNNKIDVWSAGVMLVEMMDGQPPYAGETKFKTIYLISNNAQPPIKDAHRFSREASSFLDRCFQQDPHKRWSAQQLLNHDFLTKKWFQAFEIKDNILFARQKHRDLTQKK